VAAAKPPRWAAMVRSQVGQRLQREALE